MQTPPCLPFSLTSKLRLTIHSLSLCPQPSPLVFLIFPLLCTLVCVIINTRTQPTFASARLPSLVLSLQLDNFLFIPFPFTSLPFSFKLLICFGGMKWIAHRWPNFSADFLKLISCCIPSWIPNENCVKIGKSLIRWNGKIPPPPSKTPSLGLFCYLLWMDIHCLVVCLRQLGPNFQ